MKEYFNAKKSIGNNLKRGQTMSEFNSFFMSQKSGLPSNIEKIHSIKSPTRNDSEKFPNFFLEFSGDIMNLTTAKEK